MRLFTILFIFALCFAQARETLQSDRVLFVDTTNGSDTGDGSSAWPFKTAQAAVDFAAQEIDTGRFRLTVQLAPGEYGPVILRNVPGDLCPTLSGDESDPWAVSIFGSSGYAVLIGNDRAENRLPSAAAWTLRFVTVSASGNGNRCIVATGGGARLNVDRVNFGPCQAEHMVAEFGADLSVTGPYVINGGASRHLQAFTGGRISWYFGSLELSGSPSFSVFARAVHGGVIVSGPGGVVVGTSQGKRWEALLNGVIDVTGAGASRFPGTIPGTVSSGGQFSP